METQQEPIRPKSKLKFYLGAIVILIAVVSIAGYQYWLGTPQYSLNQIQKSVKEHDLPLFKKHVDIDSLVSRSIDQVLESKLGELDEVQDEAVKNMALGFIKMLKPTLVNIAKEEIEAYIEKGSFDVKKTTHSSQNTPNFSIKEIFNNSNNGSPEFKGIDSVKKDGNIAIAALKIHYPKLNHTGTLELKMRELDNYWQLVEINNLDDFLSKIEVAERAKLGDPKRWELIIDNTYLDLETIQLDSTSDRINCLVKSDLNQEQLAQAIPLLKKRFPQNKEISQITYLIDKVSFDEKNNQYYIAERLFTNKENKIIAKENYSEEWQPINNPNSSAAKIILRAKEKLNK